MTTRRIVLVFSAFAILTAAMAALSLRSRPGDAAEPANSPYRQFEKQIAAGRRDEAMELGGSLFLALLRDNPSDPVLTLLAGRLDAAERIRTVVAGRVQPAPQMLLDEIAGIEDLGLPAPTMRTRTVEKGLLPPARELYWTCLAAFAGGRVCEHPRTQQTAFCERYYELSMQDRIMEVGRHVLTTDPNSSESLCDAVVLPLLYLHGRDGDWDRMGSFLRLFRPETLDLLSTFALQQTDRPQAAMAIARHRARLTGEVFSPAAWAFVAADACVADRRPDLADNALSLVAASCESPEGRVELQLRIADAYARCGDCAAAAHACEEILADLPDTSSRGRVVAAVLGYLAREDNAEQVLAMTHSLPEDRPYDPYLGRILYLRWWALRKTSRIDEAAQIAQRLLAGDRDNPCVAPILLERAADALARQEYDTSRELLARLTRDFAGTESAKRGMDLLSHLQDGRTNRQSND